MDKHYTIEPDKNNTILRDSKPQADHCHRSAFPLPFVASIALAFTLLGEASVWALPQRPTRDKRTPRERALDELRAIEATRHLENGDAKTYCARVSNTLREYLAQGCIIPAPDLTTGELALVLKQIDMPGLVAAQVIHVLRVCDNAKVANDLSDMDAIKTLVQISQQIVVLYPNVTQQSEGEPGR